MAAGADFAWIHMDHKFTVDEPTSEKDFFIEVDDKPIDSAYLLIQVRGVSQTTHSIEINGLELPSFDLVPAPTGSQAWLLWMDRIPPNFLKSGTNDIRITRKGNDDFQIGGVVVNWRARLVVAPSPGAN